MYFKNGLLLFNHYKHYTFTYLRCFIKLTAMFKNLTFFLLIFLILGCKNEKKSFVETNISHHNSENAEENFGIVIHGGAGTILKENMGDSLETAYKVKLKEAISAGYEILKNGGSSLDAVTQTINVMEDSPLFNSGKGAVFTHEGRNELDASIMDGSTLNAGAVAGVRHIKNPINLAKDVMQKSEHVMLYGAGAEEFAKSLGYEMMDTSYFYTQNRYEILQRILEREKSQNENKVSFEDPFIKN